jgi:hypothetical protein
MKKALLAVLMMTGCHGDPIEYGDHVRTVHCAGAAFGDTVEYVHTQWALREHTDGFRRPLGDNAQTIYAPGVNGVVDVGGFRLQSIDDPLRLIVDGPQGRVFIRNCGEGLLEGDPLPEGTIDCSIPGACPTE